MTGEKKPTGFNLLAWIFGLLVDFVLLAIFLLAGLAALNILVQVVVLIVGLVNHGDEVVDFMGGERARYVRDGVDLVLSVVYFALAVVLYKVYSWMRERLVHLFVSPFFELFVSKRYLLAREGGRLVSVISVVSVLGVAVGTAALIVVISVMQGFDRELFRKFMGVFSHVEIAPHPAYHQSRFIDEVTFMRLIRQLDEHPEVVGVAPLITSEALLQTRTGFGQDQSPALIRGFDIERERTVTEFQSYVTHGNPEPGFREVVLGKVLARRLGVDVGDTIMAIGGKLIPGPNRNQARQSQWSVVGIFDSGLYDVDERFAFTNLETMRNLLVEGNVATAIHIRINNPYQVDDVALEVLETLPFGYYLRTWKELNPQFFEALWMEKVAMFIILLLIVIVAALNIIGILVMTVVQKTRDIGILKSMGASRFSIMTIFMFQGSLIGLVGTSLGVVWGLRLCGFVAGDIDKIFQLPAGVYGLDRLPVIVEPNLIALMAVCSFLICIIASVIPAWQAARLDPVEALRYD